MRKLAMMITRFTFSTICLLLYLVVLGCATMPVTPKQATDIPLERIISSKYLAPKTSTFTERSRTANRLRATFAERGKVTQRPCGNSAMITFAKFAVSISRSSTARSEMTLRRLIMSFRSKPIRICAVRRLMT